MPIPSTLSWIEGAECGARSAKRETLGAPRLAPRAPLCPRVSVCIANWNCKDMLRACLRSLLDDQGVKIEIVVVDNASADGAADMVAEEFPEVRLVRNAANLGFSRANHQAATLARGPFLFFLNNDTLVPPGTLGQLVEFFQGQPGLAMVGPRLRDGQGHVQISHRRHPTVATLLHKSWLFRWTGLFRRKYRAYRRQTFEATGPQDVEMLMGAALFLPTTLYWSSGGWDESFTFGGEDLEFCLRMRRLGRLVYLPQIEITHFGRVSTRQHIQFASPQIAVGFVQYLRKSGTCFLGLFLYKLVFTLDAPGQILAKGLQYLFRLARGQTAKAEKSRNVCRGLFSFLRRGLLPFWKA